MALWESHECGPHLRRRNLRLQSSQKASHSHIERLRNHLKRAECHALPAGLQPIQVDTIQPGPLRELILRETLLFANPLDSFANDSIDIRLQSSKLGRYAALKHPA